MLLVFYPFLLISIRHILPLNIFQINRYQNHNKEGLSYTCLLPFLIILVKTNISILLSKLIIYYSCGCEGNNNLNILNNQMPQNGLMPNNGIVQNMNNMPMINPPMVSLQPQQVQQPVVVNTTEAIGPINI